MKVTLQILAEDIMTTDYCNGDSCAITKAFKRAGHDVKHIGLTSLQSPGKFVRVTDHQKFIDLTTKVKRMYAHPNTYMSIISECLKNKPEFPALVPEDFEYTVEIEYPNI